MAATDDINTLVRAQEEVFDAVLASAFATNRLQMMKAAEADDTLAYAKYCRRHELLKQVRSCS